MPKIRSKLDKHWGYVLERWDPPHPLFPMLKVIRRSRRKMAEHLGRSLKNGEIVHHKNHLRHDDRLSNLELMLDRDHRSMHGKTRKISAATKRKMSRSAKALLIPEELHRRSERAKKQHAEGNFGRATWKKARKPHSKKERENARNRAVQLNKEGRLGPKSWKKLHPVRNLRQAQTT